MTNDFLLSIYESNLNEPEKEYLLILMETLILNRKHIKVSIPDRDKLITSNLDDQLTLNLYKSCEILEGKEMDAADELMQNPIANNYNHDAEMVNQIYDFINTPMSYEDELKKNPYLIEQRKEFRRKMKKYVDPGNYVDINELEADQYAANKVGAETMIRAMHSMNKLDKIYAEIDIKRATENEKNSEAYKKLNSNKARKEYIDDFQEKMRLYYDELHKRHIKAAEIRSRALHDKSVSAAVRRSLSD